MPRPLLASRLAFTLEPGMSWTEEKLVENMKACYEDEEMMGMAMLGGWRGEGRGEDSWQFCT